MATLQAAVLTVTAGIFMLLVAIEWIPGVLVPAPRGEEVASDRRLKVAVALRWWRNYLLILLPVGMLAALALIPALLGKPAGFNGLLAVSQPGYEIDTDRLRAGDKRISIGGDENDVVMISSFPRAACSIEPTEGGLRFALPANAAVAEKSAGDHQQFVWSVNGKWQGRVILRDGDKIVVTEPDGSSRSFRLLLTSRIQDDYLVGPKGEPIALRYDRMRTPVFDVPLPISIAPSKTTRIYRLRELLGASDAGELKSFICYEPSRTIVGQRTPSLIIADERVRVEGADGEARAPESVEADAYPVLAVEGWRVARRKDGEWRLELAARVGSVSLRDKKIWIPFSAMAPRRVHRSPVVAVNPFAGDEQSATIWLTSGSIDRLGDLGFATSVVNFPDHSNWFADSQGVLRIDRTAPDLEVIGNSGAFRVGYGKDFVLTESAYQVRNRVTRIRWPFHLVLAGLVVFAVLGIVCRSSLRDFRFALLVSSAMFMLSFRMLFSIETAILNPFDRAGLYESIHAWLVWPLLLASAWGVFNLLLWRIREDRTRVVIESVAAGLIAIVVTMLMKRLDSPVPVVALVAGVVVPATLILAALLLRDKKPELDERRLFDLADGWILRRGWWISAGELQMVAAGTVLFLVRAVFFTFGFREAIMLGGTRVNLDVFYVPVAAGLFGYALGVLLNECDGTVGRFFRAVGAAITFLALAFALPGFLIRDLGLLLPLSLGSVMTLAFWGMSVQAISKRGWRWLRVLPMLLLPALLFAPYVMSSLVSGASGDRARLAAKDYTILRLIGFSDPEVLSTAGTNSAIATEEHIERMTYFAYPASSFGRGYMSGGPGSGKARETDYTDNVPAVFLLTQFGLPGALLLGLVLVSLLLLPARMWGDHAIALRWLGTEFALLSVSATVAFAGLYQLAGNTALMPLTGKNVYLLAFRSGGDLASGFAIWMVMLWLAQHARGHFYSGLPSSGSAVGR